MVAGWRCNPCLIRDSDAMAAALKANHSFPTRPSAKKKASDQEFARWQTQNPKIDILRSILNQIMQTSVIIVWRREMKVFTRKCKPDKLFAKHIKLDEQVHRQLLTG
ncbi:hypothetical protein BDL97_01G027100 [Sphagnum fallax]|nr:hypothetical protein BDL97_01G027100 [Sphagnum fallax]